MRAPRLAQPLVVVAWVVLAWLIVLTGLSGTDAWAHAPQDAYFAHAELRIDERRGLRVGVRFKIPSATELASGDPDAAVAKLGQCLRLTLAGERLEGGWQRGRDPKHGLSDGNHTVLEVEFVPAAELGASPLEVALTVDCFADRPLAVTASARAKAPWRLLEEHLPAAIAEHHHAPTTPTERGLRVVFARHP